MYLVKKTKCGFGGSPVAFTCGVEMKEFEDLKNAREHAEEIAPSEIYEEAGKFPADVINPKTGNKFKLMEVV
jgi:hypothetical protein